MRYAHLDRDGKTVTRFVDAPEAGAVPVVDTKPERVPSGHQLLGPNYTVSKSEVREVWKTVPVDPWRPEELLRRIEAIEARLAKG